MITIIDYGMGNLRSVSKAIELFEKNINLSSNKQDIKDASALILPGVGAFSAAMKNLEPLKETIIEQVEKGKPILGICLGLQLFYEHSTEHNGAEGFGFIDQKITAFNESKDFPTELSLPQIGWNSVQKNGKSLLLKGLPDEFDVYFVHSFYAPLSESTTGQTEYGLTYSSVIEKENIMATQFHPEKSSKYGLKILENFISLIKKT